MSIISHTKTRISFIPTLVLAAFVSLTVCISCAPAKSQTTATTTPSAAPVKPAFVQWDKKMTDLGAVKKGEKRTLFFEYTNTSSEDIQIEIVDACECTKVDFPRGVIAPGGKGRLNVTFDSSEKEAAETIGINVVFKNIGPDGNPRIEIVEYKFDIVK
jgi:peptidoglycan-associated lipoprotein